MKRYLSLLLALLLVFSLAGCAITPQADPTQPETTLAPTVPPETTQPETTLPEQTQPPQQEDPVDPNVKKAVPSLLGKTADMATKILRTHGFVAPRIVYVNSYQEIGRAHV